MSLGRDLVDRFKGLFGTETPAGVESGARGEPAPAGSESESDSDSNRDRSFEAVVERLLAENGGRVRQSAVVAETGLSKSAVSARLSAMEAAGEIDRLRIGREKIVYPPGERPDPFTRGAVASDGRGDVDQSG